MAYFEAYTDALGKPMLRIIGELASPETLAELAAMGKSPGPDEAAIVVDAQELMKWLGDNVDIELTT